MNFGYKTLNFEEKTYKLIARLGVQWTLSILDMVDIWPPLDGKIDAESSKRHQVFLKLFAIQNG